MTAALSWTAPTGADDFLLVLAPANSAWSPTDGTDYAVGSAPGDVAVVWRGTTASCNDYALTVGGTYRFLVFQSIKTWFIPLPSNVPTRYPSPPHGFQASTSLSAKGRFGNTTDTIRIIATTERSKTRMIGILP